MQVPRTHWPNCPILHGWLPKANNDLTNFIDFITHVTTNEDDGDEQSTHDTLVSNALAYGLISEGDIPRDGFCMFHALAQSLKVNTTKVRQNAAKWLRQNPTLNSVHFPDFVTGMTWECYLHGIKGHEWGRGPPCIANAFQLTITFHCFQSDILNPVYISRGDKSAVHSLGARIRVPLYQAGYTWVSTSWWWCS